MPLIVLVVCAECRCSLYGHMDAAVYVTRSAMCDEFGRTIHWQTVGPDIARILDGAISDLPPVRQFLHVARETTMKGLLNMLFRLMDIKKYGMMENIDSRIYLHFCLRFQGLCVEPRKHSGQQRMRGSLRPQTRCLYMALVWQTMVSRLVLDRSKCSWRVACMAIATRLFDENRLWYTNTWAVNIRLHATLHASIYFCPNVKCGNKVGACMLDLIRTNMQPEELNLIVVCAYLVWNLRFWSQVSSTCSKIASALATHKARLQWKQ